MENSETVPEVYFLYTKTPIKNKFIFKFRVLYVMVLCIYFLYIYPIKTKKHICGNDDLGHYQAGQADLYCAKDSNPVWTLSDRCFV